MKNITVIYETARQRVYLTFDDFLDSLNIIDYKDYPIIPYFKEDIKNKVEQSKLVSEFNDEIIGREDWSVMEVEIDLEKNTTNFASLFIGFESEEELEYLAIEGVNILAQTKKLLNK